MEQISVASIIVENRFRKDMGDIEGLAASIAEIGQIQPIVINKDRRLIAGGRRLAAMRHLGRETIAATVFDLDDLDALKVERDENDQRKEPTISEKVAIAEAVAERLQGRNKRPEKSGNISGLSEQGDTRDLAAAKAGLGSGKTLEAAQSVIATGVPELVQAMDDGKVSIHAAKQIATLPQSEQTAVDYADEKQVKYASNKARQRSVRAKQKTDVSTSRAESAAPVADESRLYEPDSSLSALVLSHRAKMAIAQISKNDPHALACIESIRAALDKQLSLITLKDA